MTRPHVYTVASGFGLRVIPVAAPYYFALGPEERQLDVGRSAGTEMTKSPTAIEFKETVRDAFGYLGREFAFREVQPSAKCLGVRPFLVWFANATTLVQVEGTNYGFAAHVILGPADAGDEWHATVPLWAIIKHRRPDLYEDAFRSPGQLAEVRDYAHALREVASDVLRGDFRVFAAARAIVDAQMIHQRLTEQERPGSTTIE